MNKTQKQIEQYNYDWTVKHLHDYIVYRDYSPSFTELKQFFKGNRELTIRTWNSLLEIQSFYNPRYKEIKQIIGINGEITLIKNSP